MNTLLSILVGFAAYYAPAVMEDVARNRALPLADCMVAMDAPIGTRVYVQGDAGSALCVVMDVPHPDDRAAIAARRIVVELDYPSSRRICAYPDAGPSQCPVIVTVNPKPISIDRDTHE